MFYLFDASEKLTDTIYKNSVISAEQTDGLSETMTLDVVVEMDMFEKLKDAIYIGHKDQTDDTAFQLYKIVSIKTTEEGISITAVHVVYDEMMFYGYIREERLTNVSVSTALGKVLNGSRWEIGKVLTNKNANLMLYDNTRAEALTKLIESFQVELGFRLVFSENKITKRYVDVYEKRGKVTHNRYVYGHKAINVDKEIDRQNVFTAIVPRGKGEEKYDEDGNATGGFGRRIQITDIEWSKSKGNPLNKAKGKDYLEIPEMTLQHGFSDGKARYKIVVFDEIEDPNMLIQKAYETLVENCRPKVQLSTTIGDSGEVELGDSIIIIRKDIDVQYRSRVFKIKRNLITRENSEVTLGDNLSIAKVDYGKLIESKIDNLKDEVQTSMTINLGQMRNELEKSMFDDDAYKYDLKRGNKYNLAPGLYTFNRPIDKNPTKGIWIGAGKVAISNRKRADGTFDWTTWATGEGIVADVINSGTLNANLVRTGILQDKNAKNFLNLDTGEFNFGDIIKSVDGRSIVEGAAIDEIDGDKIITGTVSESKIGNGAISESKIRDNAISGDKIKSNAISKSKIQDNAIDGDKIAQNAVRGVHIQNAAITNAKIENGAIDRAKIQDGEITNAKIGYGAIGKAEIQDGAITNAKIENGAITNAKIGYAAIGKSEIQDGAITNAKIENGAITNAKIGYGAVDTAEIKDAAITSAKISSLSADKIYGGTINAKYISVENLDATNINRGQFSGNGFSCGVNGYGGTAQFNGSSINFGANSGYVKIRDTGGRGEMKVDGTIAAIGHNYFVELNSGGLHLDNYNERSVQYSNAGIYLSTNTIIDGSLSCTRGISTKEPVNCGRITVSGKTIIFEDGGGLHWEK
ncbi:MAG: phage tail spike protein [Finegoldia magna]|uniref:phage tail spike protein n=1 Tax=Finegoldia magna TaxID=1260 RepID=UPI0029125E47|nr:phage tail spike protein [Finegoldia magna]MDU5527575.1 phage tail spike protein [Finegoldia magna]